HHLTLGVGESCVAGRSRRTDQRPGDARACLRQTSQRAEPGVGCLQGSLAGTALCIAKTPYKHGFFVDPIQTRVV
ncbi:MAG: hypothetical protein WCB86_02775, partial [Candidatus Dormiibacterota bacterium]